MAKNYIEGTSTNDPGAQEVYRNVSVVPVADRNALAVSSTSATYASRVDEVSSSTTYIGKAAIGTATSAAEWQVSRLAVSGTQTIITFADGDSAFDNIWDNRASLSYS